MPRRIFSSSPAIASQSDSDVFGAKPEQARFITDYDGATKDATVEPAWSVNPAGDSVYVILPFASIPGEAAPSAATGTP